jgi:hypothetical protein
LQKTETQEFLVWFAKQDFKPADPTTPPNFPDGKQLPDLPDLDLPPVTPLTVPDELKSDASAESKPAPGEMSLPTGDAAPKPADAPVTDAPAADAAPAAETPAPETPMPAAGVEPAAPVAPAPETPAPALEAPAADVKPPAPATSDSSSTGGTSKAFVGDTTAVRVTDNKP